MWESPIYKFKTEVNGRKQDIFIDLTGSAPNFTVPGKQLEGTLKVLLEGLDPEKTKILDFGAAKLRNTIYLLQQGYTVYSCEFDDLFKRSKQANDFLEKAKEYPNFHQLIFPHEFIDFNEQFDVVLLINVLNIMPVPIERYCVLTLCKEKMVEHGRLLWYTQHGTYAGYDAVTKLFDGIVTGRGRQKFHMFYRDFSRKEIHDMLKSTGFSFNKDYAFPMSGSNQAYVFIPDGVVLVDQAIELLKKDSKLKLEPVERKLRWDIDGKDVKSKKVVYEAMVPTKTTKLKEINILEQYSSQLRKIRPGGGKRAAKYHQLIFNILSDIFQPQLKNPKKEEKINRGRKRVDITFDNKSESGFFKELSDKYQIICPIIFVECKNYTNALETPEYDQIDGRLNKRRGMFGIITCRKTEDEVDVLLHCRDLVRENPGAEKYVIVLTDDDINNMINYKLNQQDGEIDNILHEKFRRLIL